VLRHAYRPVFFPVDTSHPQEIFLNSTVTIQNSNQKLKQLNTFFSFEINFILKIIKLIHCLSKI